VSGSNRLMGLQTWKKVMGWCTAQWRKPSWVMQIWTSPSEGEVLLKPLKKSGWGC